MRRIEKIGHPPSKIVKEHVSYGIYEAYYDEDAFVVAITSSPVDIQGEDMEDLRHIWVMLAEAFCQPLLDYNHIPEEGHDPCKFPFKVDEKDIMKSTKKLPFLKPSRKEMALFKKSLEKKRAKDEKVHSKKYVGTLSLKTLINNIYDDYHKKHNKEKAVSQKAK